MAGPPGAPVVMLLHGLGATAGLNWASSFDPLGRRYRVVAIDHRGHGRGIRPGVRGFRLEDCADDVAALAEVLGVDRFVAAGYSMGGPIAQLLWRRHPKLVDGLVLCATAARFGRPADAARLMWDTGLTTAATAMRLVPPAVRRQVVRAGVSRRLAATGVTSPAAAQWVTDEMTRHDPASLIEAARAIGRFSSIPWLGGVDVPTAVVVTTRDTLVTPARQQRMAAAIPGARVFPVAGDHRVCSTDPAAFVPVLLDACRWASGGR